MSSTKKNKKVKKAASHRCDKCLGKGYLRCGCCRGKGYYETDDGFKACVVKNCSAGYINCPNCTGKGEHSKRFYKAGETSDTSDPDI